MDWLNILITIAVALAGVALCWRIGTPVPFMIGSMLCVGVFSAATGMAEMPRVVKIFTQGISGAFIGMSITRADVRNIPHMVKPLLLLLGLFTLNTIILGFLFKLVFGWDLMTGLLATVAGGIADVSLIAIDLDCDASTVAIMQTMRLVFVLALFPTWAGYLCRNEPPEDIDPLSRTHEPTNTWLDRIVNTPEKRLAFTLVVSILAGAAGYYSGVAAGALLFAVITVGVLNVFTDACYMPMPIKRVAQIFAGTLIGCTVTPDTVVYLPQLIVPILIMMAMYIVVNLVFSFTCSRAKWLPLRDALFASSPGGASDMALIASDLGADLTKIAVLHICRSIYAAAAMPQIALLINSIFG